MDLQSTSDESLAKMAQKGDLDAFDVIVERYQETLWRFLFKFCPHQSELSDLVQEALIKAFQNLHQWRDSGSFKSWLMKVGLNCGYDYCRKRNREPVHLAAIEKRSEEDSDPLENLASQVDQDSEHPNAHLVELILDHLKPDDRTLVILHYYERYTLPEVAKAMNWSLAKTKVKSHRTRKRLKEILQSYGIEKF